MVFCLYPETSRRTLEDMDEIFIHNPSVFVFGKAAMTQRERPQVFIEAEERRVAAAEVSKLGHEVQDLKESTISHSEHV